MDRARTAFTGAKETSAGKKAALDRRLVAVTHWVHRHHGEPGRAFGLEQMYSTPLL